MFIKVKRTQVSSSRKYRAGVVYKIDGQNPMQARDATSMVKAKFAVEITQEEFEAMKDAVDLTEASETEDQSDEASEGKAEGLPGEVSEGTADVPAKKKSAGNAASKTGAATNEVGTDQGGE